MSLKTPLGIFWDIENCCIPRNKSVSSVVKYIRDFIGDKHPECGYAKEFSCACDVYTLGKITTESLDKNGVIVVHVNNTAKNAAEDKLQELIDMYVDKYGGTGSAVLCIISSDINLAKQIRNGRRKDLNVILIHNKSCSTDLKNLANESYLYEFVIKDAQNIDKIDNQIKGGYLEVSNLPLNKHFEAIKSRLSKLSENCGGKPENIFNGKAIIRFGCKEDAERCLQRINGSDVYGSKIGVKLCVEDMTSNMQKNKSLSQHNLAKNLDKTREKSLSQMNLTQNPNKIRNRSKSRTNFTQMPTPGQSSTSDDQKSVLKGFFTRSNDDYKEVVKNLVSSWNDPYIKPDLIQDVKRSLKYGRGEGKHTLFIEAVDANANRTLIKGSKIYLKAMEGVQWNPYVSYSDLKVSECKSIIKGLVIQKGQNISETVRRIVFQWNDSRVLPNFVQSVERGQTSKDGKTMLIVTATSPQNSRALISGSKRHLRPEDGIKWVYYHSKPNNESKASGSSAQSLSPNSVAKNTKTGIPSNVSSLMSVIKGLETKKEDNVSKIVRKIVHNWNDREVNPNFIQNVERDRKCSDKDGDVLLFVTATNPKNCIALVNAANKYWGLPNDPKWTHYYRKRNLSTNTDNESVVSDFDVISSQFSSTQDLTKCSSLKSLDDISVMSDDFKSVILGFETKKGLNFAKPVRKLVMSWNDKAVQGNFITSVDRFPNFPDEDGKIPLLVTATSPQTCVALVSGAEKYLNSIDGIVWTHFDSGNQLIDFKSDKRPQEVNQSVYENIDNFGSASSVVYQKPRIEPYVPIPFPRNLNIGSQVLEQNIINNKKEEISVTNDFIKSVKSVVNGFENLFKSSKSPSPTKPSISTKPSTVIPNPIYRPTVPFLYDIGNRMTSGLMICFSGSLNPTLNNFNIEFLAKTDIALNFNVRVGQSEVVLNSRHNGNWGPEERHNEYFPFIFGHIFDAMIKIDDKQYIIAIKGQHFCNFEHRLEMKSVTQLKIFGDITIHWLRFDNN